ncbi:hypothetical protein GCM10009733_007730 [Nonomuraea maheshkhaliensis]|uniref:DUF222 domain-containing protein n=1 Tax=Nonomuraea maheshkhaliensis TaxID=419590 RepID=A0ABN2EPT9_9ACTN
MSFTEDDVDAGRSLMSACRGNQLAIGDLLASEWAGNAAALGEFCERIGLSVSTAKEWRTTAAAVTPELRERLNSCGVFVSYTVLREGARLRGGQVLDPGYSKLLRLIKDAKAAGIDRVGYATYQTVLGTAPPLAAAKDPVARQSDEVIDYLTEVDNSPNRDQLVEILLKDEQVTRKELAAAFEAQRARQAQQAEQRAAGGTQTPPERPAAGTGGALVAGLLALAEQTTRLVKRFPGQVRLDVAQQADAAVALDDLDVFMTWARQATSIRPVAVPAQRRAPRKTVTA